MKKYTMQEIKQGQGCFTSGLITMIGEVITIDSSRRYITYSTSERTRNEVEFIGTASIKKSGSVTLVLI